MIPLRNQLTRSVAEECGPVRRYSPATYYLYRVSGGRTYPMIVDCNTLQEAVDGGKVRCQHKDNLLIREVEGGRVKCHLYTIKRKSQPRYVYRDYQTTRVHDLYADHVCTFDGNLAGLGR